MTLKQFKKKLFHEYSGSFTCETEHTIVIVIPTGDHPYHRCVSKYMKKHGYENVYLQIKEDFIKINESN